MTRVVTPWVHSPSAQGAKPCFAGSALAQGGEPVECGFTVELTLGNAV